MSNDISFKLKEVIDWLIRWKINFIKKPIALTVDMNILLTYISHISKIFLTTDKRTD